MSKIKLSFSLAGMIFAVLGLTKILPYEITAGPTFLCLSVVTFIGGIEDLKKGKKSTAWFSLLVGVLLLASAVASFL